MIILYLVWNQGKRWDQGDRGKEIKSVRQVNKLSNKIIIEDHKKYDLYL